MLLLKRLLQADVPHYTFPDGVVIAARHAWVSRVPYREGYDAGENGGDANPYPADSVQSRSWDTGFREGQRAAMAVL